MPAVPVRPSFHSLALCRPLGFVSLVGNEGLKRESFQGSAVPDELWDEAAKRPTGWTSPRAYEPAQQVKRPLATLRFQRGGQSDRSRLCVG